MNERRWLQQSGQLLRLRELREDTARAALAQARMQEAACRDQVQRRRTQIAAVKADLHALAAWQGAAPDTPRQQAYAAARRMALDDELERAEVDLIDEGLALSRAEAAARDAQAAWQRTQARRDAMADGVDRARRAIARADEQRAEREDEAPVSVR